jgi:hypothetical protein
MEKTRMNLPPPETDTTILPAPPLLTRMRSMASLSGKNCRQTMSPVHTSSAATTFKSCRDKIVLQRDGHRKAGKGIMAQYRVHKYALGLRVGGKNCALNLSDVFQMKIVEPRLSNTRISGQVTRPYILSVPDNGLSLLCRPKRLNLRPSHIAGCLCYTTKYAAM